MCDKSIVCVYIHTHIDNLAFLVQPNCVFLKTSATLSFSLFVTNGRALDQSQTPLERRARHSDPHYQNSRFLKELEAFL